MTSRPERPEPRSGADDRPDPEAATDPENAADPAAPSGPGGTDPVRVDSWLWAVRLYPTRTAATDACSGGRVRIDGGAVKASRKVVVGEVVHARRADRTGEYRVLRTLTKRVGAPVATQCYEVVSELLDHQPRSATDAPWGQRDKGAGRPTKADRRKIEQLRRNAGS